MPNGKRIPEDAAASTFAMAAEQIIISHIE